MVCWEFLFITSSTPVVVVTCYGIRLILRIVHDIMDSREFKRSTPAQRRDLIEYKRARSRSMGQGL